MIKLNWSFNYAHNQEKEIDYVSKIFEILENTNINSPALEESCYSILPNFRYNHKNPSITSNDELEIGELNLNKHVLQDKIYYTISKFDATSGVKSEVQFELNRNNELFLENGWTVKGHLSKDTNESYKVEGKIKENTVTIYQNSELSKEICIHTQDLKSSLLHFYSLIHIVSNEQILNIPFSLVDESNNIIEDVFINYMEDDYITIQDKKVKIKGYVLCGKGYTPHYFWTLESGKVLIFTSTLLTYVLK